MEAKRELVALRLLEQSSTPVGAARLAREWREVGVPGAEATAGRLLRYLDDMGYTELLGSTRGRTLTDSGISRLRALSETQRLDEHQAQIRRAINATEIDDLLDLLHMRRMVEIEAARLAALRATDDEIAALAAAAAGCVREHQLHDTTQPAIDFHRLVAMASHNRIVGAVALMLLDSRNDPLERALEYISQESGDTLNQLGDHVDLILAFEQRRPDEAARIMATHLGKLIAVVELYRDQAMPDTSATAGAEPFHLVESSVSVAASTLEHSDTP